MSLSGDLKSIPGATPLDGITGSWLIPSTKALTAAVSLDDSGERVHAMMLVGEFSKDLVSATFRAARKVDIQRKLQGHEIIGVPAPGGLISPFNAIGAWSSSVRPMLARKLGPRAESLVIGVFPAFSCEFTIDGSEDIELAQARLKVIDPGVLERKHQPFFRMRFSNERTGARSIGSELGVTHAHYLVHELRDLEGTPGFVEFESRSGELFRVEWDAGWILNGKPLIVDDIGQWALDVLHEGTSHE